MDVSNREYFDVVLGETARRAPQCHPIVYFMFPSAVDKN